MINRNSYALAAVLALGGCVVAPPPQQLGCQQTQGATADHGPTIACLQPNGGWITAAAPPNTTAVPQPPPPPVTILPPPVIIAPPPVYAYAYPGWAYPGYGFGYYGW